MCRSILAFVLALVFAPAISFAETVVSDQGVEISEEEIRQIISRWPPEMRKAAANDDGERLELLNSALANRKMAADLNAMTPEKDGSKYWEYQNRLLYFQSKFRIDQFLKSIEYPDMDKLARERYTTEKDKYAKVPERRLSSHILFKCLPGQCDRNKLRQKAESVLTELENGADFEAMVEEYSEDPGTKAKGGLFERWMQFGDIGVAPAYNEGVFAIEKIGDYSEVVDSRFGLHIIRLDDIEAEHHLPYEEVRGKILQDLQKEYRKLALKDFQDQYLISSDAYINDGLLDELLAPYK